MSQRDGDLITVDIYDREIGRTDKINAHKYPILHRAFSVFIVDGSKMLLQKRAAGKYHSGGSWANSCCSHPRAGEKLEDAAHRRLMEELGFDCALKEIYSFVYFHQFAPQLYEYEYDHVFLGRYAGAVIPNQEEIEEVRWMECDELNKTLLQEPGKFAVWFYTAAPVILRALKEKPLSADGAVCP